MFYEIWHIDESPNTCPIILFRVYTMSYFALIMFCYFLKPSYYNWNRVPTRRYEFLHREKKFFRNSVTDFLWVFPGIILYNFIDFTFIGYNKLYICKFSVILHTFCIFLRQNVVFNTLSRYSIFDIVFVCF